MKKFDLDKIWDIIAVILAIEAIIFIVITIILLVSATVQIINDPTLLLK